MAAAGRKGADDYEPTEEKKYEKKISISEKRIRNGLMLIGRLMNLMAPFFYPPPPSATPVYVLSCYSTESLLIQL